MDDFIHCRMHDSRKRVALQKQFLTVWVLLCKWGAGINNLKSVLMQKRPTRNLRLLQQRGHFHDGLKEVEVLAVNRRLEGFAVDVEDPEEDAENDGHYGQDDGRHGRCCGRSPSNSCYGHGPSVRSRCWCFARPPVEHQTSRWLPLPRLGWATTVTFGLVKHKVRRGRDEKRREQHRTHFCLLHAPVAPRPHSPLSRTTPHYWSFGNRFFLRYLITN